MLLCATFLCANNSNAQNPQGDQSVGFRLTKGPKEGPSGTGGTGGHAPFHLVTLNAYYLDGSLTIDTSILDASMITVSVTDENGIVIGSQAYASGSTITLYLGNLPEGLYTVLLTADNETFEGEFEIDESSASTIF